MTVDYGTLIIQHRCYIDKVLKKDRLRIPMFLLSGKMRKLKKEYLAHKIFETEEKEFLYLAEVSGKIDQNRAYRFLNKVLHRINDVQYEMKNHNHKGKIKKALKKAGKQYLTIVCIVKNEARYINEWIAYYKVMGADHIYLFNNGSEDHIKEVISPYVKDGYVTMLDFHGPNAQMPLYRMTAGYLKKISRWVAYIDADEFILPKEGNLKEYLKQKEKYPALGINWVVFGPGGHKERPKGLVTENYNLTFLDEDNLLNLRIKSIVDPREIYDIYSPHFCILKKGRYAVDEEGCEIGTKWMYVSGAGAAFTEKNKTKYIRINHYWTRSEQDLKEKCERGYASGGFNPDYESIMKRLDHPMKKDDSINVHIPAIKENLP